MYKLIFYSRLLVKSLNNTYDSLRIDIILSTTPIIIKIYKNTEAKPVEATKIGNEN